MDEKTLSVLEYHRILEHLAGYASFALSAEMARALRPTAELDEALLRQQRTREARRLLSNNMDASIGGVRDVRGPVDLASHNGVLEPPELLAVRDTLVSSREFGRVLERFGAEIPLLVTQAPILIPPPGLVDAIGKAISDHGDILDQASPKLMNIRSEIKVAHTRLLSKLERLLSDPRNASMLQEAIITQRNNRYVIPLKAEFKGRIRSIIHDQSSSGATLFVEPLAVVDLNNHWHELQLAERDEIRQILTDLSRQVGAHADSIQVMLMTLAELDLALMCAHYADDLNGSEPVLSRSIPKDEHPGITIKLTQARHPLLPPDKVVPVDIELDDNIYAVVITGPNTGGKTVTLKTLGLLVLMAQSGLPIPARSGSAISIFRDVFADIGDEQSIEQSLSTFSGHIKNIVRILGSADRDCLVLLDELGAGTDPQEGAALARALLEHLLDKKIPAFVATHYPELKTFAHGSDGVINASMEFDLKSLNPTFHLTMGLPGRSNALLIAERLGLNESILNSARSTIDPVDLRAEDLLDEIHRQRDQARLARQASDNALLEADRIRSELNKRLEKIEDERADLLESARHQVSDEIDELRVEIEQLRKALVRARLPLDEMRPIQESAAFIEAEIQKPILRKKQLFSQSPRPLKIGDRVRIHSINMLGTVATVSEEEVEVQMGSMRIRAHLNDIRRPLDPDPNIAIKEPAIKPPILHKEKKSPITVLHPSPGVELDLRGQRAEEALDKLDKHLELAYLAALPMVRIIHGKGTGRLRQAIRDSLRRSPMVTGWEVGMDGEGGEGVTIARILPADE